MSLDPRRTEQILNAAGEVFCEAGFARASMESIARQAEVSKATLYNHFSGKTELFRAAVRQVSEAFVMEQHGLNLDRLPLADALLKLGDNFLQFLLQDDKLAVTRAVLSESHRDPELGRSFHESGPAVAQQAIAAFLAHRQSLGEITIFDCNRAAQHFMNLVRGDLQWRALMQIEVSDAERRAHLHSAIACFLEGFQSTRTRDQR